MPFGALMFCIFVGWVWGTDKAIEEIQQDGLFKFGLAKPWAILVKFVVPLCVAAILIGGMVYGMALS